MLPTALMPTQDIQAAGARVWDGAARQSLP